LIGRRRWKWKVKHRHPAPDRPVMQPSVGNNFDEEKQPPIFSVDWDSFR
jgi:hypothetical protein